MLLLYGWFAALSRSGQRLPAGLHRCDVQAAVGGLLGEILHSSQYERCSLLAVKNSHKTVGCFLHFINGPADDLQYRCGVKILLNHGRKHEGEQDARKFMAGELLCKCVWPDLFVPGQHHGQRIQNVLPCLPHLLLSIGSILPHKAERVVGKEAGVLRRAVLHLPVHPADAGQGILKHRRVVRVAEDIAPDAFHRRARQFGLGTEVVVDAPHRYPAGCCHCTDVDRFPSILLDEDPARFQDLLLGRCHRIRMTTSST